MSVSTVAERKKYDIAAIQREQGLKCPECHCRHFYCNKTHDKGEGVNRYKYCRNCNYRVVSREIIIEYRGHIDTEKNS